jgi:hypothetical protein
MNRSGTGLSRVTGFLLVLSSLCSLCLCGESSSAAEGELTKPYRLRVVLHVARHKLLTDVFRQQVERELGDGLQAALGDLARVEVVRHHPRLPDVLTRGLERALDGWSERSPEGVKTHFVLIDFSGVHYEIRARQYDGVTGLPSPVVRHDRTGDRAFVARAAALLVEKDFGLLGTVRTAPDARGMVRVELRGGGLGVPLGRWVGKGEVFGLLAPDAVGGFADPVLRHFPALLQVEEPPRPARPGGLGGSPSGAAGAGNDNDARDGVCVCRLFQRYELQGVIGLRCVRLGTVLGVPLRLRLLREQPNERLAPLPVTLSLQVRRHGFRGEEKPAAQATTDGTSDVDTSRGDPKALFDRVAFVSVSSADKPIAQVPVPLVADQLVVVLVSATDPGTLFGIRLRAWKRGVSESLLVQINLFKEIEQLAAKPDQRARILDRSQAGARRSRDDLARLARERHALLEEAEQLPAGQRPDLTQEDQRLKDLQEGEAELQRFIARQKEIERKENDPKRTAWLTQIERARLLEKEADVGKAIAVYEQVLREGYDSADLKAHLDQLRQAWQPVDDKHRAAREFIYERWPTLDKVGLKKHLDDARQAFAVCRRAHDVFAGRKLFKATEAHAIGLAKELAELHPEIHFDDEAPAKLIREVTPGLTELAAEVKAFLDKAGPAGG